MECEQLNGYICSQICFKELWNTGDFRKVGSLCGNQTVTQTSLSHRDRLLLKMTMIQRIFQKLKENQYDCVHLWKICESLVTECNLLKDLIVCLGSDDQLIAFSACKSLLKILVGLPISSAKIEWFKENLFSFDKCKVQTKQHSWRLLYTLEFLRQIVRFCHGNQDAVPGHTGHGVKPCNCGAPKQKYSVSKYTLINMCLACDKWLHILPLYIPFWNDLWRVSLQERETQILGMKMSMYSNMSYVIHQKELSSSELDENGVISFMTFLLEVVKHIQITEGHNSLTHGNCGGMLDRTVSGFDQQNQTGYHLTDKHEAATPEDQPSLITTEVQALLQVFPVLISLLHLPSLPAMCFKSILNVLGQVFVPLSIISPYKDSTKSHRPNMLVLQSSAALISGMNCCFMKNIPQSAGFAGFGGPAWRSLGCKNPQRADPVSSRKLSLLLLKASHALLEYGADESMDVVFNTIMSWSSNLKLLVHDAIDLEKTPHTTHLQHSSREEGLFCDLLIKLFSDQDDELIEALLLLLRIYQTVQSFIDKQQVQRWSHFIQLFDPHGVFISLLHSTCFDHSVLLDFLISPETCFLSYILFYLRFMLSNWQHFSSSIKDNEEVMYRKVERDSPKLLRALEDFVSRDDEERNSTVFHSRLPLSSENSPSKGEDLCSSRKSSTLPSEPSNLRIGDSVSKLYGQAARLEVESGGLRSIAMAYVSEESSEDSEEDREDLMDTTAKTSILGRSLCEESIEEADMSRIAVEMGGHYVDRVDNEPNIDIPLDCVSVLSCGQFTLEDSNEVVVPFTYSDGGLKTVADAETQRDGDLPDVMGRVMAVLIRLRLSIERLHGGGLFPYNAEPLLRLIRTAERLYDGC